MEMSSGFHTVAIMPKVRRTEKKGGYSLKQLPDGCEWFRTCSDCGFGDCEATEAPPLCYDWAVSRTKRCVAVRVGLVSGVMPEEIEEFFGLRRGEALAMAQEPGFRSHRAMHTFGTKAEAIRARRLGRREFEVASDLGVTPRTVRRWCEGAEGIDRGRNAVSAMRSVARRR